MSDRYYPAKLLLIMAAILVLGILYWHGANEQLILVNTRMKATDQSAYMNYARQMAETNYTFVGGRNRMPLYPFFQSLFYDPGMSDEAFFLRGKYVNTVLSMVLLIGISIVINHSFHWLHTVNIMLILAFTVFIFKAGFFQAELLFYFLNFCLFVLMWRLLRDPSWRVAILTGIVTGLAHLTKASVLPGLVIFLFSIGLKWLVAIIKRRDPNDKYFALEERPFIYYPVLATFVVLSFLSVVFPYLQTSKKIFGHYFYNVNSTFYIWYDSWEEAKAGTAAHGDRIGWPDMPASEIPSMSKYLSEHTSHQILDRFLNGSVLITIKAAHSYGYFKYVVFYFSLLIVAVARYRSRATKIVRSNLALSVFIMLYFPAYFILYAWYSPIVDGNNRFILAQFLPFMFTVSVGLHLLLSGKQTRLFSHQIDTLTLINIVVLGMVTTDIAVILTDKISTMYGGF